MTCLLSKLKNSSSDFSALDPIKCLIRIWFPMSLKASLLKGVDITKILSKTSGMICE